MKRLIQKIAPLSDDVAMAGYNYLKAKRKAEAKKEKKPALPMPKVAEMSPQAFYEMTRKFRRGMRYGKTVSTVAHGNDLDEVADELEAKKREASGIPEGPKKEISVPEAMPALAGNLLSGLPVPRPAFQRLGLPLPGRAPRPPVDGSGTSGR